MDCDIIDLYEKRHSFYKLGNKITMTMQDIHTMIKKLLELYPSAFNAQEARLIILSKQNHLKFWEITKQVLLKDMQPQKQNAVISKIDSFAKGFGTILYFMDNNVIAKQEQMHPLYAHNFNDWAKQSNSILQFMIWTAFANKNIGASIQHYSPLIDEIVKKEFNIPVSWHLVAQMPFGSIEEKAQPHSVDDISSKLILL